MRAKFLDRGVVVGKYSPRIRSGFIAYAGGEYGIPDSIEVWSLFEDDDILLLCKSKKPFIIFLNIVLCLLWKVLVGSDAYWANSSGGYLVIGGHDSGGNNIYICKVNHKGYPKPGKLHNGRCYTSYSGKEISFSDWDTLKQ